MTRLNAALLAGVVSVLLFAATIAAAEWFMRAGGLWWLARLGHYLPILTSVFSMMFALMAIALMRRRTKAKEQDDLLKPLPVSERLKNPRAF